MPTAIKEEKWEINIGTTGLSTTSLTPASGATPYVFHEYEVPVGVSLVFTAEDIFALYLYQAASAESGDEDPVDVVITDSSRQNIRPLLQQTEYRSCAFYDLDTGLVLLENEDLCHRDISPGDQIIAREGERIQIRASCGGAQIDGSVSYFRLTCKRIRHTLFG